MCALETQSNTPGFSSC